MKNQNTISYELSEKIRNMSNKGYGLGRIFNHLRKMDSYSYFSDYSLFRFTLAELASLGKLPSKENIKHHFRTKVDKDDWEGVPKSQILRDLYNPTR